MKKRKNKAQQAVAAVVMGMNLVNTMSPLALAAQAPVQPEAMRPAPQAQPLEYTVLPQFLQAVEGMVFARAEAALDFIHVSSGQTISSANNPNNTFMYISSGGTGIIGENDGGNQSVFPGGVGSIATMNSGNQYINSGGQGFIETMSDGFQSANGGTGNITTMNNGYQVIRNSGSGHIETMYSGYQWISHGGVGSIETMNSGQQEVRTNGTGIIETMSGGDQYISSGGTGIIDVMSGGDQYISSGGTGSIGTMDNGRQFISSGASGSINILSIGNQSVYGGGVGSIGTMSGGGQVIKSGGNGSINTMNGGNQYISGGGNGSVETMNSGNQMISSGGNVSVNTMNGGNQYISSGGNGSVNTIYGGIQYISSGGNGSVNTMNGGIQYISSGANGSIDTMNNGMQSGAGNMSISVMNGGTQSLTSAATGNIGVMNDGEQQIGDTAVGIISSLNGGTQILNGDSATAKETIINGGVQLVQNGTAQNNIVNSGEQIISGGKVTDTTINGGTQIISGGVVSGNTVNAGVMLFENTTATVNDVDMNGGEMLFGSADAYKITSLNFNGGTVDLTENASPNYQTLTLENYSGSGGTFVLDADLETGSADKVTISAADEGAQAYLGVVADGYQGGTITLENEIELINDESGKVAFTAKQIKGAGLYNYIPVISTVADPSGGTATTVNLTGIRSAELSESAKTIINSLDNAYALWRSTNDTLRARMGELHSIKPGEDGVWARYLGGKFDGSGFDSDYNMYQLGYDKAADAKSIYGFAVEKGDADGSYSFGSSESDLFAGSIYGTWLADDGSYTDVVARVGRYDTDLDITGQFPDSGDYSHNAYSLSVEYGKNIKLNNSGVYIEPHVQFIAGRLEGIDFTTDEGKKVSLDGVNSYIGRVGFTLGQQLEGGSVYFKAAALHDFGGDSSITLLNAAERYEKDVDYGDTWYELGVGGNVKIGHASYFYGEVERSFGGDIDKEWQINAGLRFEF